VARARADLGGVAGLGAAAVAGGELRLSLEEVETPPPGPGEVLVRVEAAPINPSDLILLLGPAELGTLQVGAPGDVSGPHRAKQQ